MIKKYHSSKRITFCEGKGSPEILRGMSMGVAVFSLLIATLTPGRSEEAQGLWGVWQGKIVDGEIYVCIQADPEIEPYEEFLAIYSTADHRIELLDRDKNAQKKWSSRNDRNVTATLSILRSGSIKLDRNVADAWSGIELAPILFAKADQALGPCESKEFNQPRAVLPPLKITSKTLDGMPYDTLTVVDPAGHGEVSTFQLAGISLAQDIINNWLHAVLPETGEAAAYYTCTVEALGAGRGSFWEERLFPEMISDRFIVVGDTKDVYCGGPYSDRSTEWTVFNSLTGEEVDTRNWIHPDAFNLLGPDAGAGPEIGDSKIETGFRDLMIQAFIAAKPDASCRDLLERVNEWNIRPSKTGFILSPVVAHVEQGCAIDLNIGFRDMDSYLTKSFQNH